MNAIELPPCLPQELLRLEVPEGDDAVRRAADQELVGLGDVEVEHGGVLVANCVKLHRSSRKIDSQRLFSREYEFPKTFSLTENQFFREDLFLYNSSLAALQRGELAAAAVAELAHGDPFVGERQHSVSLSVGNF